MQQVHTITLQRRVCMNITNVDLKILSKVLARRLEGLLTIIVEDQTGFIKGRNSYSR